MGASLPVRATLCLAAMLAAAPARADKAAPPPPLDPGLTERAESRLVQFEVRVSRKGVPVSGLTAKDFDIELSGKPLAAFTVDDMCSGATAPAPTIRPGSFIFYFDDPELTVEGRLRAIEVARLVAPALIAQGHDVLILRNGPSLRGETSWTHDLVEVSSALDRIASDPGNRDSLRAAMNEIQAERLLDRTRELVREGNQQFSDAMFDGYRDFANGAGNPRVYLTPTGMSAPPNGAQSPHGQATAGSSAMFGDALGYNGKGNAAIADLVSEFRTLVQDELVKNGRDIDRLRGAVRSLSLRPSPKGIVYFSDTLRRDPGGVITRLVGSVTDFQRRQSDFHAGAAMPSWTSDEALTALVRDASTYGVRFYAVEGRGLVADSDWVRTSQDTLVSLALDTGGRSFVNGLEARSIADSIAADQSCWYLVSFVPSGWEVDRPLGLAVWSKKPGLHVSTLSSLIIPSRATLTQARLLAAHMGDPTLASNPLAVSIYPVGGTAQRLQVLAQVRLPEGGMPQASDTTWNVGFDVVSGGAVIAHNSGRVAWRGNGQPPVYQSTLWLPAGPYELVAVAQEEATDAIRSGRLNGTWPASSAARVTLSRPALAQPQSGGIVLDGHVKSSGIVVRGEGNPVDPRRPAAIVTALCVDGPPDTRLRAERSIVGQSEVSFDPMTLGPDEGRCVQIRDMVAAGTFGAGRLTYFVRILSGDDEIAAQEFSFDVAEVQAPPQQVVAPSPN